MDMFKLGDKILDLLNMVFGFWNNQVSLVFGLLGQSPESFKKAMTSFIDLSIATMLPAVMELSKKGLVM